MILQQGVAVVVTMATYRCEVRPGPEYVLRQYRFYDGGMFDLRLFHYSDSHCRSPTYSLTARGQYRPYQTSWIVDGATEMDYHLWHVAVVPYQTSVVYGLRRRLVVADGDGSCARHVASLPWQAYEKREIYTHIDAYDVDTGRTVTEFTVDQLLLAE